MLVITTPTGKIGSQVLDKLRASQESIRVIVRDPARLPSEITRRVEVVQGSHDDLEVVTAAFADADCVLWLVPPNMQVDNVIEYYRDFTHAACQAIVSQRVPRVVAVSSLGREAGEVARHAGHLSAAFAMEEMIEQTGVHVRALRMPYFKENLLQQVAAIKTQGMFFLPNAADLPLATVATPDVAAAAATLLLDDSWTGSASVPVAGPDDLSPNDMARTMSDVLQRPVRFQQISSEAYQATMLQYGMAEGTARGLAEMAAAQDRGLYNHEARTPPFAIRTTSFPEWCEQVLKPAVLD